MRHALSPRAWQTLAAAARDGALLVFDFDGTLAPIVRRPAEARMRPRTHRLLSRLARARPCAIVSGRSLADLKSRLARVPLAMAVGNHGAETGRAGTAAERAALRSVERWRSVLERRLDGRPGLWVENKRLSLAVHYREAPRPAEAAALVRSAAHDLGARLVEGHRELSLVPHGLPDKGRAVRTIALRLGSKAVIFVGDDATDEHVFELRRPALLGVRIGRRPASAAGYYLRSQGEVDEFLARLLAATNAESPAPP